MKRLNKDGSPDKRFTKKTPPLEEKQEAAPPILIVSTIVAEEDPQMLFNRLLEENNLQLDFDVLEGTIPTKFGVIKLDKQTLVVKASYVPSK